ncbi:hypothetical protein OG563_46365 [Nocardia vinacea]|uniref:Uncharacterized protein n=1 Tax=Nocardia vinacea TaxID=96468 RepID=A0ABZ1YSZ3_9NOCA|nr:hypothetical protein [Nocardia vinacea]
MTALPSHAAANSAARPVDRILAEVHSWPLFAGPVIHARTLTATDDVETFQLWLEEDGSVRSVTLERRTSEDLTTLVFGVGAGAQPTVVRYGGDFADGVDIETAAAAETGAGATVSVEPVVRRILTELTESADLPGGAGAWVYTFEDVVRTHGAVGDVVEFLRRLELWPDSLAHVDAVAYDEDDDGVQTVWTTVFGDDGTRYRIPSIRICVDSARVIYKPLTVPPIARAHLGQWSVEQHADSVTVTGRHTVALDPAGVRQVLGDDATVEAATRLVRSALGKHSLATLEAAKSFAENRLRSYDPALSWDRLGAS